MPKRDAALWFGEMLRRAFLSVLLSVICSSSWSLSELHVYEVGPFNFGPGGTLDTGVLKSSSGIMVQGVRGEYRPASLIVYSDSSPGYKINIEVSDLISDYGEVISKKNIEVYFVKEWFQASGAWISHGMIGRITDQRRKRVMVPELLLKDDSLISVDKETKRNFATIETSGNSFYVDISEFSTSSFRHISPTIDQFDIRDSKETQPFDIASDEPKRIWLDIHFPSDASSGIYRGSIRFLGENKEILDELPLLAEVLPFDLKESGRIHGLFYRSKLSESGTISSENKSEEQIRAELKNIRSHGVNLVTLYSGKKNSEALDLYKEFGFSDKGVLLIDFKMDSYVLKGDLGGYLKRAKELKRLISKKGIENLYIYGIDEANVNQISLQREFWSTVKESGVKVFSTGYSDTFPKMSSAIDIFAHAYKPSEEIEISAHEADVRVLSYANPQSGVENPERFRINYGMLLWAYNYDGSLVYAYQDAFGFIYNDFDHDVYRDHNLTYPTSDGV